MRGLQNRTLDFEGEFYKFKNVPIEVEPLQKPHPPLWYGAGTPQSVERPARTGMSIVTNAPAAVARTLIEHYWKHHKGPRTRPKTGFTRHLVVADTDEAALAIARRGYRGWIASFMKLWLDHGIKPVGVMYPAEFDGEGMNGRAIAGSPANGVARAASAGRRVGRELRAVPHGVRRSHLRGIAPLGRTVRRARDAAAARQGTRRRRIDPKGPVPCRSPSSFKAACRFRRSPRRCSSSPIRTWWWRCCRAGIIGTFPALNNRSSEDVRGLAGRDPRAARPHRARHRPAAARRSAST